jgi:hypothetical protein
VFLVSTSFSIPGNKKKYIKATEIERGLDCEGFDNTRKSKEKTLVFDKGKDDNTRQKTSTEDLRIH